MGYFNDAATRAATLLLTSSFLVAGCSSSSDSPVLTENNANEQNSAPTMDAVPDPLVQNRTQVNFDITVPAYQSDALQVRLIWGDTDVTAGWVGDELWSTSIDLPADVENTLSVTFSDRNGDIVLAYFEQAYRTSINASETYTISSDQFNTASLDADEDGVSNIDELISGTDPLVDEDAHLEVRDFVVIN
ncbi:MAG: hypothetical protein AB8B63_24420 [Granulosicoccus sp.]